MLKWIACYVITLEGHALNGRRCSAMSALWICTEIPWASQLQDLHTLVECSGGIQEESHRSG